MRVRSKVTLVSRDAAAQLADDKLREFIASMAAAGNPGSGRHEIGLHHVQGWILEYDPTIGGAEVQAVIGIDGVIHALRDPRSLRTHKLSASDWVLRTNDDPDPAARVSRFAEHLSQILAFDHVGIDAHGDEQPPWGPHGLTDDDDPIAPDDDTRA